MGRVFVVQRQVIVRNGQTRPKYDFSPAEEYGELVHLLPADPAKFLSVEQIVGRLYEHLHDYNGISDYILPVGRPAYIGWAVAIAAHKSEVVSCLEWSGEHQRYFPIQAALLP